jgi:hypothetical protein
MVIPPNRSFYGDVIIGGFAIVIVLIVVSLHLRRMSIGSTVYIARWSRDFPAGHVDSPVMKYIILF